MLYKRKNPNRMPWELSRPRYIVKDAPAAEKAIGTIFTLGDDTLICLRVSLNEEEKCRRCFFCQAQENRPKCLSCQPNARSDRCSVIYKKLIPN